MKIIITSGSTFARWDSVRGITNISKGTTGSKIAEEALCCGHSVEYIANENAKQPFELKINPNNMDDVQYIKKARDVYQNYTYHKASTFKDYLNKCLEVPNESLNERTVFISAAAVSDYAPVQANGKMSSAEDSIKIELTKLPKVISEIKAKYPMMPVVGFKLLSSENSTLQELIEVAYKSLLDLRMALVVANLVDKDFKPVKTVIITPEKNIIPVVNRDCLASILIKIIEQRIDSKYYSTEMMGPLPSGLDTQPFLDLTQKCAQYSLFSPYGDGRKGADFGSIAMRTEFGMLTTGRGTTKQNASKNHIAMVDDVDNTDRIIKIFSDGTKSTLNATTLWNILHDRKEVNYIVHAHVYLPNGDYVEELSAPGTDNDYAVIKDLVLSGSNVINQVGHGCLILLKRQEDLLETLLNNGLYNSQYSKFYDEAYYRFESGILETSVAELILNKDIKVLDLACGTGKSAAELINMGFNDVNIADGSRDMLNIAEERINKKGVVAQFEDLSPLSNDYDLITIRQAFPYLDSAHIRSFAAEIYSKLNKGGYLIFNTFKPLKESVSSRYDEFETDDVLLKTTETNIITSKEVVHSQRTEYLNSTTGEYIPLYDINIFNQYNLEDIRPLFEKAGFDVEIKSKNKSVCFIARSK
jgi:ubiquinone/menaquinone biosynthesis C-methylase UbiE